MLLVVERGRNMPAGGNNGTGKAIPRARTEEDRDVRTRLEIILGTIYRVQNVKTGPKTLREASQGI